MRISATSASLWDEAYRLLNQALRLGAFQAEVFGLWGRSVNVDLQRDQVEIASESIHCGLGLRAVVKGAVGFSCTSDLSRLEEVAKGAIKSAQARGPDDQWRDLPLPKAVVHPEKVFDPSLHQIRPDDCLDMALSLVEGCKCVDGVQPVSGGVTCAFGTELVVNSNGVELSDQGTSFHAGLETIAKGSDLGCGYEFGNSRSLDLNLREIGRRAAELARRSQGGTKIDTGTWDVLLQPVALAELLEHALIPSFSAENVQKGRSPLAGRVGQHIAKDTLALVDDGFLTAGMGTSSFDDEGVPSQRTVLVEDGILKGFLYDSYTAGKEGRESTSNALRPGYSDLPRIGIRNLILSSRDSFDLLHETRRGVLVHGVIGSHTANPISGDFSVEVRNAFNVQDGAVAEPIRSAMIAGNIFDLLLQMEVGCDPRAVGAMVVPMVRVKMKVIG